MTAPAPGNDRLAAAVRAIAALREAGIAVLLVLLVLGVSLAEPSFLSAQTLRRVLLWAPLLLVVAIGQMMVIATRGIDVSVGSTLGLSAAIVAMAFRDYPQLVGPWTGVALGLLVGGALGAVNGALVAFARIPPIIATLGTLNAYRGLTFIASGGRQVSGDELPPGLLAWTREPLLGIPHTAFLLAFPLAVVVVGWFVLKWTRFGRGVYAIGGNPEAAALRGLPVRRTLFAVYAACGALAGLAGVLYASRYGFVNPSQTGFGFELTVIAAVVIGGVSIFGGVGTVLGVVLGCLLLGTINVALAALGIAEQWQLAIYGALILVAVVADDFVVRRMRRRSGG